MPVVGVTAIGAGGGSVAWVDEVGVPKVGPRARAPVRARPATAAAARTPRSPTPSWCADFSTPIDSSAGGCALDPTLAEEAVQRFADRLGMSLHEAAESAVRVAVSNMYAASTKILSRAGVDPRDFALVAFGGAGPLVGASSPATWASPPSSCRDRPGRSAPSAPSPPTS